jgi:hypothetical protein
MTKLKTAASAFLAVAILAAPAWASAAPAIIACTVNIDYSINGVAASTYAKSFEVSRVQSFSDDLSTPLREETFNASAALVDNHIVVSIDYFKDVSTFNAIALQTSLQTRGDSIVVSTGGSNTFSSSVASPAGNHRTTHSLVCVRHNQP